ncbi:MAG: transposase [Thermoleophilaceae bacterium]|nr:transposase [Thermoleophilaceae bacterium]
MRCPDPEHAGSRIKLDGTYGQRAHRRQRYKCAPAGGRPHVFTELLPREESWHGDCQQCERHLERREGPKAPRHYQFVARGIAEALAAVGTGDTYMRASRVARDRARRFRFDAETGEVRESAHGQLVADWVELFAPVVYEPHRPTSWPAEGSLLLDHLPFRIRAEDASGRGIPGGTVAFDVFCAVGYRAGKPKLWHAEAFSTAHPANWSAFLASLEGAPKRVVCDAHRGMLQAIGERWPETELHQCEWHLQHALKRLLTKELRRTESEDLKELRERADGALAGPNFWRPFVAAAKAVENESLDRWIAVNGPTIETQFARRPPPSRRPAEMPLTTAALEQLTRPIAAALYPRRYALKNRQRLNRLLLLMQLHINGDDDVQAYSKTIRELLERNGGRPVRRRRSIADPANSPSLR